jgi:hypothetical protein
MGPVLREHAVVAMGTLVLVASLGTWEWRRNDGRCILVSRATARMTTATVAATGFVAGLLVSLAIVLGQ